MNKIITTILLLVSLVGFSQQKYFSYEEVEFSTDLEKRTIAKLLSGEAEPIDGFLIISSGDSSQFESWKGVYSKEIEKLKDHKKSKKLSKEVKYVYDNIHDTFLTKYENLAYFDQVFETGVYNCVTAVALYGMAFEAFDIPYHIKETPRHVYIVADPDDSQLLIETTDPISGFKTFTPGFKEQFVARLAMMKLTNQNDIASKGIYGVFDEFYFGGAELSLNALIGIQYYNKGVSLFNEKDYHGAWKALKIAQLFHSNDQIDNMLFASIVNIVSFSDYSDWDDIQLLPYLERFLEFDIKETNVVGEFQRMINYVLIQNNNAEKAQKAYDYFMDNSKNEELKKEATYTYYHERSVLSYNRGNYRQAFDQVSKAYIAKPGNANAENLLMESFRMSFANKSSEEALAKLDTLLTHIPELAKNNRINTTHLNLYLSVMHDKFDTKRATEGNTYKKLFEEIIAANPDYIYDRNILGNAYSKAAVYYFKRGYTSKARGIIQTGLKYAPGNYQLKTRLRMISR